MSAGMVHNSGKMWDVGHGINGHTDMPSTLIRVIHSCHVHVCMCVINNFSCFVYPSATHSFPSSLFTWGLTYGCAHLARLRLRVRLGCTSALRYLHSEAGGSLQHLKHTQVARAAKNDATRDGYSFTFKGPVSTVVARPAATPTLATLVDCCALRLLRCKHLWRETLLH